MAAEEQKPKSGLDEAIKEVEGVPVDEASKWMEKNISYVDISAGDPPKQRRIGKKYMAEMAKPTGTDPEIMNTDLTIFDPKKVPIIEEGKQIKAKWFSKEKLGAWLKPKHNLVEKLLKANKSTEGEDKETEKTYDSRSSGYCIFNSDIEEFLSVFEEFKAEYYAWGQRLLDQYPEIRELDKKRCAGAWPKIVGRYPTRDTICDYIKVHCSITPAAVSLNVYDHLPPKMKEQFNREAEITKTNQLAAIVACIDRVALDGLKLAVKQCGNRKRVHPDATDADYANLRGGEVVLFEDHEDDKENIPEGYVRVDIQLVEKNDNDKTVNKKDQYGTPVKETLLMPMEEFNSRLKPRVSEDEYGRLHSTTIEGFFTEEASAKKWAEPLAFAGSEVVAVLSTAREYLDKHGSTPEEICKNLKKNPEGRAEISGVFSKLSRKFATSVVERKDKKKVSKRNLGV